ncbi:MAG: TAXI family TRAP transporter solute-binding subunit [bacterium]
MLVIALLPMALTSPALATQKLILSSGNPGGVYYRVSTEIAAYLAEQDIVELEVLSDPALGSLVNRQRLIDGEVDLALLQNDTPTHPDIKAVLPIYPEVLHIIYPDSLAPRDLKELVVGRRVAMGPEDSGTARFTKYLLHGLGIEPDEYTPVYPPFAHNFLCDSIDVSCAVTGLNNPLTLQMVNGGGGKLWSLDDPELAFRGSTIDGFCLHYPQARSFIIPKSTYGLAPSEPILTVAVDAVLVCRADLDAGLIYDMVRGILAGKPFLAQSDHVLNGLTEEFDPQQLNFTLHDGCRQYLERDRPGFFERYAEVFGLGFTIMLALYGAITALARWRRRRKKDRIDVYYEEVLAIKSDLTETSSNAICDEASRRLYALRERAFVQLVNEQLAADESFRIFVTLLNDVLREIASRRPRVEAGD